MTLSMLQAKQKKILKLWLIGGEVYFGKKKHFSSISYNIPVFPSGQLLTLHDNYNGDCYITVMLSV